jgi:hypothetical protein
MYVSWFIKRDVFYTWYHLNYKNSIRFDAPGCMCPQSVGTRNGVGVWPESGNFIAQPLAIQFPQESQITRRNVSCPGHASVTVVYFNTRRANYENPSHPAILLRNHCRLAQPNTDLDDTYETASRFGNVTWWYYWILLYFWWLRT